DVQLGRVGAGVTLKLVKQNSPDHLDLGVYELGKWACVEIAVDVGAGSSTLTAWRGAASMGALVTKAMPDTVSLGPQWPYANPSGPQRLYFDDVVVAPAPIGCLHEKPTP